MTEERMALERLLEKCGATDLLREAAEFLLQRLMELEVEAEVGAGRYERSADRRTWRNGYRERALETRIGRLELRIPKLRQGSYFPSFLEPRRLSEQALVSVVQQA